MSEMFMGAFWAGGAMMAYPILKKAGKHHCFAWSILWPFILGGALAALALETVLIKRAGYTDEPPREGLEGMVLALEDALDERDRLRAWRALLIGCAVAAGVLLAMIWGMVK